MLVTLKALLSRPVTGILFTILSLSLLAGSSHGTDGSACEAKQDQAKQDGQADTKVPANNQKKDSVYKTDKQKVSYGIGLNIGRSLKSQGLDVDPKVLVAAISDILQGREQAISEADLQAAFERFESAKQQRNLAAAEKFLAENAKKEGVKTTKTGLQYKILKAGTGATPTAQNTVTTHYRGRLLNGTIFDESYSEKEPTAAEKPISFPLNGVIKGWTEGLQLLKEGSTARLFVHPKLAYGERSPPGIPPNSLLIFDITLLSVK